MKERAFQGDFLKLFQRSGCSLHTSDRPSAEFSTLRGLRWRPLIVPTPLCRTLRRGKKALQCSRRPTLPLPRRGTNTILVFISFQTSNKKYLGHSLQDGDEADGDLCTRMGQRERERAREKWQRTTLKNYSHCIHTHARTHAHTVRDKQER